MTTTIDRNVFDIVIKNGTVMDPESGFNQVTNIGVSNGEIQALTKEGIRGIQELEADGLIVGPGAIDLHSHGQDQENYRIQANDGVTTALELELGVADISDWYAKREGKSIINFGASIGHIPVRMKVMNDPGEMLPVADAAYKQASVIADMSLGTLYTHLRRIRIKHPKLYGAIYKERKNQLRVRHREAANRTRDHTRQYFSNVRKGERAIFRWAKLEGIL